MFRAEKALELRHDRERAAQRVRGEAQAAFARAEAAVAEVTATLTGAIEDAADAYDPVRRAWQRNWIVRLRQDRERRVAMARDRRASLDAATAAAHTARRDVRALERLKTRAYAGWIAEENRRERKDLDWLGTTRFMQQRAAAREEER